MTCGVYSITNKNNGKIYIGASIDIEHRWREHVRMLKKGDHCNRLLKLSTAHKKKQFLIKLEGLPKNV
jgi:group I intron endonuclease